MSRKTTLSAIGGWQSFLFCVGMYLVALVFSIFVCSSIFYVINAKRDAASASFLDKGNSSKQVASVGH